MKYQLLASTLIAALLASLLAPKAEAIQAYAIEDFNNLISFDTTTPFLASSVPFNGATTRLDGIDFRPANGLLYGYDQSSNQIVTVNPVNGATTFVSSLNQGIPDTDDLGIDFNPAADRLRLVDVDDGNLRINVNTGATLIDGTLVYAAGDPNFGTNPTINEAAYTNNDNNPATTTSLFYIDYALDILATTSDPNGDVVTNVTTVGSLGVNTSDYTGFDIFTSGGSNTLYAILSNGTSPSLYTINQDTGAATLVGGIGDGQFSEVFSLALVPVPEPSSLILLTIAGAAAFRYRRRK